MKLSQSQVEQFHTDGYLRLEDVLDPQADLRPVIAAYEEVIDQRARQLHTDGRISSLYESEPFERRLAHIGAEAPEAAAALDIYLVRHAAMFHFLCNEKLHEVIESLIGPEILCHPCQHLRAVVPTALASISRTTEWHQDAAVLWPEADDHLIVTSWIPLVDVTLDSGCLQVIPGSHQQGLHAPGEGGQVAPEVLARSGTPLPLPVRAGGMILFHNYALHAACPNTSDTVRWSMDLRWQDPAKPTGRPFYPGFIVQSQSRPQTVQSDYAQWRDRWVFALDHTKGVPTRRWPATRQNAVPAAAPAAARRNA